MRIINQILHVSFKILARYPLIYRIVLIVSILRLFLTTPGYCDGPAIPVTNPVVNTIQNEIRDQQKKEKPPVELKRIKEVGGEVVIDGSLRVLEPVMTKVLDLTETTTPVTPVSNHVRLYAVESGTFTIIKVLFDDGTSKTLANN